MLIKNGTVISPFRKLNKDVQITNDKITRVADYNEITDESVINASDCYVIPGLIDIHTHGAGGGDFIEATEESFNTAGKMHLSHGVTTLLPTLSAAPKQIYNNCIDFFSTFKQKNNIPFYPGLHLEGPYFAVSQKGAQEEGAIRLPTKEEYKNFVERKNNIARISFAPEVKGAMEMADYLRKKGVLTAVAHSDANMDETMEALEHGVELLTHFYSGMSMTVRKNAFRVPGIVETGYLRDEFFVEVISDARHLPPQLLQLIYKVIGPTRIIIISDSLKPAGLDVETYSLDKEGKNKIIIEDHVAKLPDRSAFAGSITIGNDLIRTFIDSTNASICEAVEMMTVNPAKVLKLDNYLGRIAADYQADITILDKNLDVKTVIHKGKIAYTKS